MTIGDKRNDIKRIGLQRFKYLLLISNIFFMKYIGYYTKTEISDIYRISGNFILL